MPSHRKSPSRTKNTKHAPGQQFQTAPARPFREGDGSTSNLLS
eukprot:CAMPEP_0203908602 /NCGR_PEP_ID=MMETSP0359-20131031/49984_1 /ASSEMBLY_ACC=CAM_ASM_000338 /TAXON_ID=268821 /ORGANISM="Scrippsiella Hangoei, Strain SHTV-5" /LENGTH=42 /DNA_ID= /DNA_START= /DNA_END= /DNA_ORIENTATION=